MDTQTVVATLPNDVIYVSGTVNGVEYTWTNTDENRWEAIVERNESEIYVVALTLINDLGTATSTSFTLYYGTLSLITDRTAQDVERWRQLRNKGWAAMSEAEKVEWQTALKGAYNAADLNRVEGAVGFVAQRLNEIGYVLSPQVKTTWEIADYPTKAEMERYLGNIAQIRSTGLVFPTTPQAPSTKKKLDYLAANDIEKILTDVDRLITNVMQGWFYTGDVFTGEI